MNEQRINELKELARKARLAVARLIHRAGSGHIGGDFSEAELVTVLYHEILNVSPKDFAKPTAEGEIFSTDYTRKNANPNRDRFLLSKGHCIEMLLVTLAERGFFPASALDDYLTKGSCLIGHPSRNIPGIEFNTGALGHGLGVAVGMALAGKLDGRNYLTWTIMGDGEMDEGSVWEAAQAAAHYRLGNLVAILDRNQLQNNGPTESLMAHGDVAAKWTAFGWDVTVIPDGNDMAQVLDILTRVKEKAIVNRNEGKPQMIIAQTEKGHGISPAAGKWQWHHHVPSDEEMKIIEAELAAPSAAGREG